MITIPGKKMPALFGFISIFLLLISGFARAQNITADVLGTVTDNTGAVLPGATVTIEDLGTHETRHTTTSSAGDYTFTLLPIGTYTLRVSAPEFSPFSE